MMINYQAENANEAQATMAVVIDASTRATDYGGGAYESELLIYVSENR